jgi:hypothetical protein
MHTVAGIFCAQGRDSSQLNGLIRKELRRITATKESYDSEFPEHARCISPETLWRIARNMTLEGLCEPASDENGEL